MTALALELLVLSRGVKGSSSFVVDVISAARAFSSSFSIIVNFLFRSSNAASASLSSRCIVTNALDAVDSVVIEVAVGAAAVDVDGAFFFVCFFIGTEDEGAATSAAAVVGERIGSE